MTSSIVYKYIISSICCNNKKHLTLSIKTKEKKKKEEALDTLIDGAVTPLC